MMQNFIPHVSKISMVKACKVLQGTCQPRTSQDGQSQYWMTGRTSVYCPCGTYLSGTFLLDHELSDWAEGGNLSSWSKKQRTFSLSLLVVFSVRFKVTVDLQRPNFANFFSFLLI